MKEKLLKIINHYGVMPQLKHFQSEVFELNEAIIDYQVTKAPIDKVFELHKEKSKYIAEEIADVMVMIYQFPLYYYEKLDVCHIAPYEFKTDNYENIKDINKYLKDFTKYVFELNCAVIRAEEREQDYISEYFYNDVTYAVTEVIYMLLSIKEYYHISTKELKEIGKYKIDRQIERIENENN